MKPLIALLVVTLIITGTRVYAQCPENIGFEEGILKNWKTYVGSIATNGVITLNQTALPVANRHEIMIAGDTLLDPYGHFPRVSPNGSKYSVRLGNSDVRHEAERLSYTFTVPAVEQYTLVLNYAVVLQNFNHLPFEQPRFSVTVFNITDNAKVECPAFNFVASSSLPGFQLSDAVVNPRSPNPVYFKDWSSTTINLSAYVGKQIRLEFTTNDCIGNVHFGYAYFDINENCQQSITGNTYCQGQNFINLQGPRGFLNYTWYNEAMTEVGSGQTLRISPAPPNGTKYILKVSTLAGLGCTDILNTIIEKSTAPFIFKVKPTVYFCQGSTFNLTTPDITEGSMPGLLPFEYYKDPVTQEYLRDPYKISEPGTYYIKATSTEGCTNMLPVAVKMYDPVDIVITGPTTLVFPAKLDLTSLFVRQPTYRYFYYANAALSEPLNDYRNITVGGTYYIKALSADGCEKVVSANVLINPPPPYIISGPTAFTPNNDGINDLFSITIKGFVDFGTLSIYNRAGQSVYKTNKQTANWDGNLGGRPLSAGTYYWLFEGTDNYYHTKVTKSGYVSIIK